ncbi:MAG: DNA mismatch repair endonuclease MutL, partial [Candidatus Wallbacteria bacterium]|nr:DNA mismatch repair endonuclease MutL [Candidatus Wallbacteria bacterium]
ILSEDLINRIAAGEIIERPANIVKELLENSIDAGANRIVIEIKDGGRKVIQVTDNGHGMKDEDLLMAFERHATSKICTTEDLYRINTLGFRGEALPSIASVAKVEVFTKEPGNNVGNYLRIEGGDLKKIQQMNCSAGTCILVRDLFYNTPGRHKFLKSISTENHFIVEVVLRYILGYPELQFTLINNNRVVLKTPESSTLEEAAKMAFGAEAENQLLEVNFNAEDYPLRIRGFLSRPVLNFPKSTNVYFLVNRRYIRSKMLLAALLEGYRGYLMVNKYPAVVLNLELNPELFDVNVHPAKTDVRFENEKAVYAELLKAISQALTRSHSFLETPVNIEREKPSCSPSGSAQQALFLSNEGATSDGATRLSGHIPLRPDFKPETVTEHLSFSKARIIGQFKSSFILCEIGDDLLLIDQHAAHEKIMFETLREMYMTGSGSQPLLIPVVKEFPLPVKNALLERREGLSRAGLVIEDFGGSSLRILEIPAFVNQKEVEVLFSILKQEFVENCDLFKEEMIKVIACHRAVKNGDPLREDEVAALLKGMEKLKNPFFCPHGRPVVQKIGFKAVERLFGRT